MLFIALFCVCVCVCVHDTGRRSSHSQCVTVSTSSHLHCKNEYALSNQKKLWQQITSNIMNLT